MTDSQKLDILLIKINNMNEEIQELKSNFKEEIDELRKENMETRASLGNEIKVNIRRVAEGHLDLLRNIRNVMDAKKEMEGLAVRVNMLESEVREQRRKLVTV